MLTSGFPWFPKIGAVPESNRNLWTDAYLGAFAISANVRLVTYDRGFSRFESDGLDWQLLH